MPRALSDDITDSPFAQYLNTNYVPSHSELKAIDTHLLPQSHKALPLEEFIRGYSAEYDRTLKYIQVHKALISPARRLPGDYLNLFPRLYIRAAIALPLF
ncbi:hypothetical protein B0H14DRAFT_3533313 [Mycena olivaceomarginata]|nr:hypothetical protein B0H14DRAFT_3533313 [Mycena olivaceomarginata]